MILLIAILGFSNAELFAMTQDETSKEQGSNTFILPDASIAVINVTLSKDPLTARPHPTGPISPISPIGPTSLPLPNNQKQ